MDRIIVTAYRTKVGGVYTWGAEVVIASTTSARSLAAGGGEASGVSADCRIGASVSEGSTSACGGFGSGDQAVYGFTATITPGS